MLTEHSLRVREGDPPGGDARPAQLRTVKLMRWSHSADGPKSVTQGHRLKPVLLVLALLSCNHAPKEPIFPTTIAPGWTRSAVHSLDKAQFPTLLRNSGIEQGWETEYRAADGAVAVIDAYAVQSNTQGLDLVQKWRPERNNAQFYTDHFLLNVAWQQAGHDELASLVRTLPKLVEGTQ
jgi:hypothetical protein